MDWFFVNHIGVMCELAHRKIDFNACDFSIFNDAITIDSSKMKNLLVGEEKDDKSKTKTRQITFSAV